MEDLYDSFVVRHIVDNRQCSPAVNRPCNVCTAVKYTEYAIWLGLSTWPTRCTELLSCCGVLYRAAKKLSHFVLYALTSSNIDRFSNLLHCQNQENIWDSTVTKARTTPQVCRYTTLWNVSVLKATTEARRLLWQHSSKSDTLNIRCKYCRMRQLLYIITETINTLFLIINFLKCVVTTWSCFQLLLLRHWHFTR